MKFLKRIPDWGYTTFIVIPIIVVVLVIGYVFALFASASMGGYVIENDKDLSMHVQVHYETRQKTQYVEEFLLLAGESVTERYAEMQPIVLTWARAKSSYSYHCVPYDHPRTATVGLSDKQVPHYLLSELDAESSLLVTEVYSEEYEQADDKWAWLKSLCQQKNEAL